MMLIEISQKKDGRKITLTHSRLNSSHRKQHVARD
jgi:hypothetical protein